MQPAGAGVQRALKRCDAGLPWLVGKVTAGTGRAQLTRRCPTWAAAHQRSPTHHLVLGVVPRVGNRALDEHLLQGALQVCEHVCGGVGCRGSGAHIRPRAWAGRPSWARASQRGASTLGCTQAAGPWAANGSLTQPEAPGCTYSCVVMQHGDQAVNIQRHVQVAHDHPGSRGQGGRALETISASASIILWLW